MNKPRTKAFWKDADQPPAEAGAHVDTVANWHSNVVVDRELITGQQPMSAPAFGDMLVEKLNAYSASGH